MIEPIYPRLGATIRAYRRNRGLSQQSVAESIGILRLSLLETERGRRRLQIHELLQLADLFEVSVQSLLNGEVAERAERVEAIDAEWREW